MLAQAYQSALSLIGCFRDREKAYGLCILIDYCCNQRQGWKINVHLKTFSLHLLCFVITMHNVLLPTHNTVYGMGMYVCLLVFEKCKSLNDLHTARIFVYIGYIIFYLEFTLNFNQKGTCGCLFVFVFFPACSTLCGGGPGGASGSKCTLGNSLMHSVMKLASGVAPDNSTIQKLAFSLLANLAMSRECRGLLQKV